MPFSPCFIYDTSRPFWMFSSQSFKPSSWPPSYAEAFLWPFWALTVSSEPLTRIVSPTPRHCGHSPLPAPSPPSLGGYLLCWAPSNGLALSYLWRKTRKKRKRLASFLFYLHVFSTFPFPSGSLGIFTRNQAVWSLLPWSCNIVLLNVVSISFEKKQNWTKYLL